MTSCNQNIYMRTRLVLKLALMIPQLLKIDNDKLKSPRGRYKLDVCYCFRWSRWLTITYRTAWTSKPMIV